jgi:tetratricopeptide (TPR) repeat protein
LAATGGDSKQEHRARDLAGRAANAAPSVSRLRLAAQLAEDRNMEREWLERAAATASPTDVELLLAQARLARGGTYFRDAVPIFEKVLAIDPDNTAGTLGLVELYVEAGLKRTAATTLEHALARRPHAVALLRAYARYAALRFDDTSFLSQQIEIALARQDRSAAVRWLERFSQIEPDTTWTRALAAHTYRGLGDSSRALLEYQRGLAIAPEDVATLRAMSDVYGDQARQDEQLRLLRQILTVSPQAKDVREYVEHIEPTKPRADEAYAWDSSRFLPLRDDPSRRYPKRTLRNLTVTTVFSNGLASRFRQIVFQPLTDEAAAAAREYGFEYQADRQTVTLRAARVYRKDGKIDESIESGEGSVNNPALATYTSTRAFYVRFSRLNAGDLVELRYRVDDVAPRNEIADYFGEVEYLGSDEPVANSEYVLIAGKTRTLRFNASSIPGVKQEILEQGENRVYRFLAEQVEPVRSEPVMPPWAEVVPHVHVSTFKTWDEVGAWYWGLARDQFDVDDEIRKRVKQIAKGAKDDAARIKAIYKYATELRYVALEFGLEGLKPRRAVLTLARGWGDCKDKATLIVTMLRELGIPATIVIVRTGMRGNIEPEPASLAPFDHAIAYVPSLNLYLDGTAEHAGVTELPPMDRGAVALQINEGHPRLVRLPEPPPEASVTRRKLEVTIAPDGAATFALDLSVSGAYAPDWRRRYLAESTRRERAQRDFGAELGSLELAAGRAGLDIGDLDDAETPVTMRARGKLQAFTRREGHNLVVSAGAAHHLVADYASLSNRTLDIELHALTRRDDEWSFKLPANTRVVEPPVSADIDTPFGSVSLTFEEAAGRAVVRTSLAFKMSRIHPSDYEAFRKFCETVDRVFGQRMVLGTPPP